MQSVWIDNYNQINLYKNSNTKLKLMRFEWLQLQLAIIFFFLPSSQVLQYRWLLRDITCYLIIFSYPRLKYFEHRCLLRDITYLIIFSYPRLKYFEHRCLLRDITCYLIFFSYPSLKYYEYRCLLRDITCYLIGHSFYIGPIGSFYNQVNDTGSLVKIMI
jgi:hypothetical protein